MKLSQYFVSTRILYLTAFDFDVCYIYQTLFCWFWLRISISVAYYCLWIAIVTETDEITLSIFIITIRLYGVIGSNVVIFFILSSDCYCKTIEICARKSYSNYYDLHFSSCFFFFSLSLSSLLFLVFTEVSLNSHQSNHFEKKEDILSSRVSGT